MRGNHVHLNTKPKQPQQISHRRWTHAFPPHPHVARRIAMSLKKYGNGISVSDTHGLVMDPAGDLGNELVAAAVGIPLMFLRLKLALGVCEEGIPTLVGAKLDVVNGRFLLAENGKVFGEGEAAEKGPGHIAMEILESHREAQEIPK